MRKLGREMEKIRVRVKENREIGEENEREKRKNGKNWHQKRGNLGQRERRK